ncbi:uncharacterized protein GIQ15_05789 [Arthroderma uncinatum]|uniref:uncharacterized protein n=1 Tax=Arthroderma uncinatum TaxID=74035 RepID=UPI00144A9742|nr:uncharacterized protein GIQ15_05789 [Arthroderma uncinatum]KAF3480442.1 hypothetical protein GIQ15_05789 [Arthroderma uncinatum]
MQIQALLQVFASALAISGVTAELHEREIYARDIAPGQLRHLAKYQAKNARSLSPDQHAALERMKRLVKDYAVDDIHEARAACESAFGDAECKRVLHAGRDVNHARRGPLVGRAPTCECADQSPYCPGSQHCKYKLANCNFTSKGCGALGLYVCNGLCE